MWRNYLTVGVRALAKARAYALINIVGLAIGMAACLLILLHVRYERSYDDWLPEGERTFQVQTYYADPDSSDRFEVQAAPYVSKAALLKDFPQIESAVHMGGESPTLIKDGEAISLDDAHMVDGPFFDVIDLPFVRGNARALSRPGTAVLTAAEAVKRFGTTNIVGRTITLIAQGQKADYRVGGILRDLPRNSHLAITLLARADYPALFRATPDFLTQWGWNSGWVYVKLRPGADAAAINGGMDAWKKRNIPDQNDGEGKTWALVAARDVHLGPASGGAMTPTNDRRTIATFGGVALLILAMASINFTNLSTARASQRALEVALRKVLGASRRQLVFQFLGESILIAALALVLALAMTELALPHFAAFLEADLRLRYLGAGGIALPAILLVLVVGGAGGLYPAFFLSRFEPARVCKANNSAVEPEGSGRLRSALVVVQFAVSIGLMVCTGVIYAQTVHARSADPGFEREGLIQLAGVGAPELRPVSELLARRIAAVPGVSAVGRTEIGLDTGNDSSTGVTVPGRAEPVNIGTYAVDADFFRTMGMKLVAGRAFDPGRPMDDMTLPYPTDKAAERALVRRGANVVLNEAGVRRLGFSSPAAAIGKQVARGVGDEYGGSMALTVVGVVGDARLRSVRQPLEPIMFSQNRDSPYWLVARFSGDPAAVRGRIERVWRQVAPDVPFDAAFSDDILLKLYRQLDARARLFAAFAVLAVTIGCLGLFGLAAFTAERRTKEIGVRKVLGARTRDIMVLLISQFSRPVLVANLLAWPIAWRLMRGWLNGFDDRIALTPTPFVAAGAAALVIAVATVGGHAWRVARTSPVRALRYE